MKIYKGKGVYGAVAVGSIMRFGRREPEVRRIQVADTAAEKQRFTAAKEACAAQLHDIYEKAVREVGGKDAAIFEAHRLMLYDCDFDHAVFDMIEGQSVNAEYAVLATAEQMIRKLSAMDDAYMRERAADLRDVSGRLIRQLDGAQQESGDAGSGAVLCAAELTPSETVLLDKEKVIAFVTARGSLGSHTTILARDRNIPAVIGVGEEFLLDVTNGTEIIVDGFTGEVFVSPDPETRERLLGKQREEEERKRRMQSLKGGENVTMDGTKIDIFANIGSIDNLAAVRLSDAGGIGLFRSEFLYLESGDYPTEEQQFSAYKRVLEGMEGKKVIIRTLDIGADKRVDYFGLKKEENPAMGCRAIRLCLTQPKLFKTQLRALYRASVYGNLGILFPMITSVSELKQIMTVCGEVRRELSAEGVGVAEHVELGIMIETPAAALISDRLAPMVDFFSVGTNDLTQYTLACDRQNPEIEQFMDPHHEAVLRLIELSAENAHKHGIRIGICGELAADTTLTETFLRMGIDELSVSPSFVLTVREAVRKLDLTKTP